MLRKYFYYFLVAVLVFASNFPFSGNAAEVCLDVGYSVFTINGIWTDEEGAKANKNALSKRLGRFFNGEPIIVDYLHNPSHIGGLGDVAKSVAQAILDTQNLTDVDLNEMLLAASQKLTTQKLLLVAHSQGNFYSNSFYGAAAGKEGGLPKDSIAIYGVATPSSFVAGGGKYLTSDTDKVINLVRDANVVHGVLPANVNIVLKPEDDQNGHKLAEVYLKYQAPRIIKGMQATLSELKVNSAKDSNEPCLLPPKLTPKDRVNAALLKTLDLSSNIAVGAAKNVYQTATAVVRAGSQAVSAVVNTALRLGGAEAGQRVLEIVPRSETERAEIVQRLNLGTVGEQGIKEKAGQELSFEDGTGGPEPPTLAELQKQLDEAAKMVEELQKQVDALSARAAEEKELAAKEDGEELEGQESAELAVKQQEVCSVNINTASIEDLQKITGVGPVISQRIVEARPFATLGDLTKVSGIGNIILQKIIDQGCAYAVGGASGGMPHPVLPQEENSYENILISEIQVEGDSVDNDFIELYNSGNSDVDISGYKLRKRNSAGNESSIRVLPSGSAISAKGYFLWANSGNDYNVSVNADASSTATIAKNNSMAFLTPDDVVVSALAWGVSENPFVEGTAFPDSPGKNKSLGRIWQQESETYKDSGDNSSDFEIQTPTPKAKNQSPEPETPSLTVVINEIAWAGTQASSTADQWIELYNTTDSEINLTGWYLLLSSGTEIAIDGIIYFESTGEGGGGGGDFALGPYFVIERKTDDKTAAQLFDGSGALLRNQFVSFGDGLSDTDCEVLSLYDSEDNLIDKTSCFEAGGWPAGKASPDYVSMERINPETSGQNTDNWADNDGITKNGFDSSDNQINGTPGGKNSVYGSE